MADKNILRKNNDWHELSDSYLRPDGCPRLKYQNHIDIKSSGNVFKKLFPGSKVSCKLRSNSYDRNRRSSKHNSNSNSFLPPRSITMDPAMLFRSIIPWNSNPFLPHFACRVVAGQSDILNTVFKLDILEEHTVLFIDKYPFIREVHTFLCSEKYYMLEMLRKCSAYSDPLRKFSSLSPSDRFHVFQNFESICEKLVMKCEQVKEAFNSLGSPQECSDIYQLMATIGYFFNLQLCTELNSYKEQIARVEKLHVKLLRNGEYHDFFSIVEERNTPLLDCLKLPLTRTLVYTETLRNLLLISDRPIPSPPSSSSSPSRQSSTCGAAQQLKQNLLNVLSSLSEMSSGFDMNLDVLQKLFPHDDLMLGIPVQNVPHKSSIPEPIKRYKLTKKKKPVYNYSVPAFNQKEFPPDRAVILCSSVQLHKNLSMFNLFLLTDILVLAKGSVRDKNLELKERIDISQMWLKDSSDDPKNINQSSQDKSLVIGWPLVNMTVTFDTVALKESWRDALLKQMAIEKAKEVVKSVIIKVEAKMADTTMCKMIQVKNDETSFIVIQRLLKELRVENREVQDFQLCVIQETEDSAFELSGHEFPFCIQLQELKHLNRDPQDKLAIIERRPLFLLRDKKKQRPISEENMKTSSMIPKRKKLKNIFRKSKQSITSKFFGQNLSAIFIDGYPPQNLKRMLERLFEIGPYCSGIFRKSANHAKLKHITSQLDSGLEVDFSDVPVIMIANIMKKFLRSLPDCLLMSHLYSQWLEVAKEADEAIVIGICKKQYGRLLPFNQSVLLDLMCILRRIDESSQFSAMTSNSLAICIGPSLLWPPRVNSMSNINSNTLGGLRRALNDLEDDLDAERQNFIKGDPRINTVSQDADDVNKVIETLIKYASKIFGDERYNLLIKSFESNSLQVTPFQHSMKDGSTDGESAVSSEHCEDKSHFSSMGTVDDSTDFISGDEKFSSLEENPERTSLESSIKNDDEEELIANGISDDNRSDEDIVSSFEDAKVNGNFGLPAGFVPSTSTLPNLRRERATPLLKVLPRLMRQRKLMQESFDMTSNLEDARQKRDSQESSDSAAPHKETISAAFANIARKLREGRKKETNSNLEPFFHDEECSAGTIMRKSSSLYDRSNAQDQSESKVGLLQRRGMTEKGEDVFPKQIVHSFFPKKNVSLIELNEDQTPLNEDTVKGCSNPACLSSDSIEAAQQPLQPTKDSQIDNHKSTLWSLCNHHRSNKNVFFGRRLQPKLSAPCDVTSDALHSIRLPPPSYEEATEYLRKKNLSDLSPATSRVSDSGDLPSNTKNKKKSSSFTRTATKDSLAVKSDKISLDTLHADEVIKRENNKSSEPKVTKIIVKVVKSPTIHPVNQTTHFIKRRELLDDKPILESEELPRGSNVERIERHPSVNNQRRRRNKRHSDPRLKTARRSSRAVIRSRSDVADSMHKTQQQQANIPDLLEDLKKSGILVELNRNARIEPPMPDTLEMNSSSNANIQSETSQVSTNPRSSRSKEWRIRLSQHFKEIDENTDKVDSENYHRGIPASIVGNCRQKFESLISTTPDAVHRRIEDETSRMKPLQSLTARESSPTNNSSSTTARSSNFYPPTPSSDVAMTTCSMTKNGAQSASDMGVTSSSAILNNVELQTCGSSKNNNFEKLKSIFDKTSSHQEPKASENPPITGNVDDYLSLDVIPSSHLDAMSSSKQAINVGHPVVMNIPLGTTPHHSTPGTSTQKAADAESKAIKGGNTPWSVARLKRVYSNKNNGGNLLVSTGNK